MYARKYIHWIYEHFDLGGKMPAETEVIVLCKVINIGLGQAFPRTSEREKEERKRRERKRNFN